MNTSMQDSTLALAAKRHAADRRRRMLGVTLLELMAVVMILGILGIVALPAYRNYAMRAQRTDAKAALLRLATNQERFYLQNRRYGGNGDFADLGFANPMKSEKGAYSIAIASVNNLLDYTATATVTTGGAIDQTLDTDCQTFTLNNRGVRTATPDPNPNAPCW